MKKLIFTALFGVLFLTTNAQYFGFQAGSLVSDIVWRTDLYTYNTLPKPGFIAGVTLDIPIKNTMAVNLALNYKWTGSSMLDSTDVSAVRFGYINLDVTFNYIFETNVSVRPYIEGGGFGAYLVNAQSIYVPDGEESYSEDVKIGYSNDDEIIPWDLGLTIGGGIYLKSWKFGAGYSATVIDLSPNNEMILRNSMGYLKATFFLGRKNKN
jgi:hypothetical protein